MAAGDFNNKVPLHDAIMYLKDNLKQEWRDVGRHLGLPESDIDHINSDYDGNTKEKCYQMLKKWQEVKGSEATVSALENALKKSKRNDLVDSLTTGNPPATFTKKKQECHPVDKDNKKVRSMATKTNYQSGNLILLVSDDHATEKIKELVKDMSSPAECFSITEMETLKESLEGQSGVQTVLLIFDGGKCKTDLYVKNLLVSKESNGHLSDKKEIYESRSTCCCSMQRDRESTADFRNKSFDSIFYICIICTMLSNLLLVALAALVLLITYCIGYKNTHLQTTRMI